MSIHTKRTFAQTIESLRRGSLAEDLDAKLQALVLACSETERAGSITLVLKLKPDSGGAFDVIDDIKVTMPKEEKGSSLMFPTVEGFLSRVDQRQGELDGITVAQPAAKRTEPAAAAG